MSKLVGVVAVVTGASRGLGKGIALELGAQGATVYVTGRTLSSDASRVSRAVGGTITETARAVDDAGGKGIAVVCDHADDRATRAVFDQIAREQGRLDILVNNVFSIPDITATEEGRLHDVPFWKQSIAIWDEMHTVGLRSHYVASVFAAPLLLESASRKRTALIATVSSFAAAHYALNVAYGVGKAGTDRLAADMAHDLLPYQVTSVALWPGVVRTERLSSGIDRLPYDLGQSESPQLTGRAVVALAADPLRLQRTGKSLVVAELAQEYGFTDIDGTQPRSLRRRREPKA
jgi:dehydrogenase/reductase SDR family member 1